MYLLTANLRNKLPLYFLEKIPEVEDVNEEKYDENNENENTDVIEEEPKEQVRQEDEQLENDSSSKEEFDLPEEKDHEEDAKPSTQTTSDVKNSDQDNVQSMDTDHSTSADKACYFKSKIITTFKCNVF